MPAWFVSYAWRDDTSPTGLMREQRVDQACEAARERGVVIHRDKDVLRPGDSIERFMRGIGAGDRIFVFLSDKYLRSPFCMFELCEVWRQSRQDAEILRGRLRLWTLGDADVWTPEGRASYARYWRDRHDRLSADVDDLGGRDLLAWQRMRTFHNEVGDILATLGDTVQPRDFEEFLRWGFSEVPRGGGEAGGVEAEGGQGQGERDNRRATLIISRLIILVHGIRTRAKWYRVIRPVLQQHGFTVELTNYGRFDLIRFLLPGRRFRRGVVDKVRRQIDGAKNRHPDIERPSYIAHSFGTYIISNILDNEISFVADRIIFCGSVVSADFKFDRVKAQFTPDILNDIGTRDYWPALAEGVTSGYGSTGTYGFNQAYVADRWHNGIGHSGFFTKEFCEKFWVDFLKSGTVDPGDTDTEDASWWIRFLPILVSKWTFIPAVILCLIIYVVTSYCGTSGSWSAHGLHGGADFGGTLNDKHFADYHEALSDINVQINIENCDKITAGSVNTFGEEQIRDVNLLLRDPRFRPIPPTLLSFEFLEFKRKTDKFSIDFKGSNANAPKSSARLDGEFANYCPLPRFIAKFFNGCIKFHGDLSIFRTDAESPLVWQATVPVAMSR